MIAFSRSVGGQAMVRGGAFLSVRAWLNGGLNWLSEQTVIGAGPDRIGPNLCPHCGSAPYPAGTCERCGYTLPPAVEHKLFSDNNLPALIFAIVCWIIAVGFVFALVFRVFLGVGQ